MVQYTTRKKKSDEAFAELVRKARDPSAEAGVALSAQQRLAAGIARSQWRGPMMLRYGSQVWAFIKRSARLPMREITKRVVENVKYRGEDKAAFGTHAQCFRSATKPADPAIVEQYQNADGEHYSAGSTAEKCRG